MVLRIKSEKNKKKKVMGDMRLPEELVLSSIIPLLSMKDVARSSLVSQTWLSYWHHTPILTFHDPSSLNTLIRRYVPKGFSTYYHELSKVRKGFITWVNNVLTNHIGCTLEEFKLIYYLDNTYQVIVDRWLVWALSKQVQRLVLDFSPPCLSYANVDAEKCYYVLDRTLCNTTKLYLTTLCLNYVHVDALTIKCLLDGCASTLENLRIKNSHYLTSITAAAPLTSLKSLMVVNCPRLETIDIQAPNLMSLTYNSSRRDPVLKVFNIKNASKLSSANICVKFEQNLFFVLRPLFKYFSHLEHLKLDWHTDRNKHLVLDKFPVLANLKHLEIFILESARRTLCAWIPFIGACPRLEKLSLEVRGWLKPVPPKNVYKEEKCPLNCLKTFEIRSFDGNNLDVDIANFLVHNGINLQEVILHPCELAKFLNLEAPFAHLDFELPPHVKLVVVK